MADLLKVRIDKWLWSVRAYKTRTEATNACSSGKVKIEGKRVKAAQMLTTGEVVEFKKAGNQKIYKVLRLIQKRVGAQIAQECYEDLSPPEIREEKLPSAFYDYPKREKGAGRPTKKERRKLDRFKGKQ